MNKYNSLLCICAIMLCLFNVKSQEIGYPDNTDLEGWTIGELRYKLNKKHDLRFGQQYRLRSDISTFDKIITQIETSYEIFNDFDIRTGLRYIGNNDKSGGDQGFENHLRWHFDVSYKLKFNVFRFKNRLRYQNRNEIAKRAADGDYYIHDLRWKTALSLKKKKMKIEPEISAEWFYRIEKEGNSKYDRYRLTCGLDYEFTKNQKINLFYKFEKEIENWNPKKTHIIGIKYTFLLKRKTNNPVEE